MIRIILGWGGRHTQIKLDFHLCALAGPAPNRLHLCPKGLQTQW